MTKKELEQYRSIIAEMDEVRERINNNIVSDTVVGSSRHYPFTAHVMRVEGIGDPDAHKKDKLLLRRLEKQKYAVEDFIHNIPDSQTRRIFRLRYIDGEVKPSWQWIAFRIGRHDESYPRRIHNRFMKKIIDKKKEM